MGILRSVGNFLTFGHLDRKDAKKIRKSSERREADAREELENQRDRTKNSLQELGDAKVKIYSSTLTEFAESFRVIGKVDLKPIKENSDFSSLKEYKNQLATINEVSISLKEMGAVVGAGAALGSGLALAAYGMVSHFGVTAAGTAIGTLGGVVAKNATLAFLGGGALTTGGAGMTGGAIVLGGVALAPALALGMFYGTKKGKHALNEAMNYSDQVDVFVEKVKTIVAELYQIQKCVDMVCETITSLDKVFQIKLKEMEVIIERIENRPFFQQKIVDPAKRLFRFDLFSEDEKQIIMETANCAKLIKELIDMPIMDENGGFISGAYEYFEERRQSIENIKLSA